METSTILALTSLAIAIINLLILISVYVYKWYYKNPIIKGIFQFKTRRPDGDPIKHMILPGLSSRRVNISDLVYVGQHEGLSNIHVMDGTEIPEDFKKLQNEAQYMFKYDETLIYIPVSLKNNLPRRIRALIPLNDS